MPAAVEDPTGGKQREKKRRCKISSAEIVKGSNRSGMRYRMAKRKIPARAKLVLRQRPCAETLCDHGQRPNRRNPTMVARVDDRHGPCQTENRVDAQDGRWQCSRRIATIERGRGLFEASSSFCSLLKLSSTGTTLCPIMVAGQPRLQPSFVACRVVS